MSRTATGFWVTLGITTAALALSGLALAALAPGAEGGGALSRAAVVLTVLPPAAALAAAGILARSLAAVAVNALAFCLPVAAALLLGFFVLAHPGGPGGFLEIVGTGLFWVEVLGLYLGAFLLAGLSSAAGRLLLPGGRR